MRNPGDYFSDRDDLLGDSAFTPSPTMVPAYKKFCKQITLASGQNFFNDFLSSSHSMIGTLHCLIPREEDFLM
jgi:hypothetical protein